MNFTLPRLTRLPSTFLGITLLCGLLGQAPLFAGTRATVSFVSIEKDEPDLYQASAKIVEGKVKTGDSLDAVGPRGDKIALKVTKIRNPYQALTEAPTSEATVYLFLKAPQGRVLDASYVLVGRGETIAPSPDAERNATDFKMKVAGKLWEGKCQGNACSWNQSGMRNLHGNRPFLALSFRSRLPQDGRSLNLIVLGFREGAHSYTRDQVEVLWSGPENALSPPPGGAPVYGHKHPNGTAGEGVVLKIEKFRLVNPTQAKISGKISGTLKLLFGRETLRIEEGSFTDLEIAVNR